MKSAIAMMLLLATLCVTVGRADAPPKSLQPRGGWIGMGFTLHSDARTGRQWVLVQQLVPRGPADAAGLRSQDVITAINGKAVRFRTHTEALAVFAGFRAGEVITFEVIRLGARRRIAVTATPLPPEYAARWKENAARASRGAQ